jgi:hypothetical protein
MTSIKSPAVTATGVIKLNPDYAMEGGGRSWE